MRTLLVLVLILFVSESSGQKVTSKTAASYRALQSNAVKEGEYHCVHPAHTNAALKGKYPSCDDPIPIFVLFKEKETKCVSLLPYNTLVIHTDTDKKETFVDLELRGVTKESGYKFKDDGICFRDTPGGGCLKPAEHLGYGKPSNSGSKVRLTVTKQYQHETKYHHDALVWDGASSSCEPIDPIIVNRP